MMLLEKFVEQHRVYRFVAHSVRLAVLVAGHQLRVHFFHVLSHKAELRDSLRVKLALVAEGHRLQRENRFAALIHRFHCFLEACRGDCGTKMTVGIDYDSYSAGNCDPTNPGDIAIRMCSYVAV